MRVDDLRHHAANPLQLRFVAPQRGCREGGLRQGLQVVRDWRCGQIAKSGQPIRVADLLRQRSNVDRLFEQQVQPIDGLRRDGRERPDERQSNPVLSYRTPLAKAAFRTSRPFWTGSRQPSVRTAALGRRDTPIWPNTSLVSGSPKQSSGNLPRCFPAQRDCRFSRACLLSTSQFCASSRHGAMVQFGDHVRRRHRVHRALQVPQFVLASDEGDGPMPISRLHQDVESIRNRRRHHAPISLFRRCLRDAAPTVPPTPRRGRPRGPAPYRSGAADGASSTSLAASCAKTCLDASKYDASAS